MDGLLVLIKPPGLTSFSVVAAVRRRLGVKKVGHGGTLDPGAAGVLPLAVGKGTRILPFLLDQGKRYRAELVLGWETSTGDREGIPTERVPEFCLTHEEFLAALPRFTGEIEQIPPMVSAKKVGGRRLYDLAREGLEVEREPQRVTIYGLDFIPPLEGTPWAYGPGSVITLDVWCSKGTYIRTLCSDLGRALGIRAHMGFLLRTASGPFGLEDGVVMEELDPEMRLLPLDRALGHLPGRTALAERVTPACHGLPLWVSQTQEGESGLMQGDLVRLYAPDGRLLGVHRVEMVDGSLSLRPQKILAGEG